MSDQLPVPSHGNVFERIKRTDAKGGEFWSARELARVLEYSEFRHFQPVIEKAQEACLKSNHTVEDHFEQILEMVSIGSGAQRPVEARPSRSPRSASRRTLSSAQLLSCHVSRVTCHFSCARLRPFAGFPLAARTNGPTPCYPF